MHEQFYCQHKCLLMCCKQSAWNLEEHIGMADCPEQNPWDCPEWILEKSVQTGRNELTMNSVRFGPLIISPVVTLFFWPPLMPLIIWLPICKCQASEYTVAHLWAFPQYAILWTAKRHKEDLLFRAPYIRLCTDLVLSRPCLELSQTLVILVKYRPFI